VSLIIHSQNPASQIPNLAEIAKSKSKTTEYLGVEHFAIIWHILSKTYTNAHIEELCRVKDAGKPVCRRVCSMKVKVARMKVERPWLGRKKPHNFGDFSPVVSR
jgi:hypothetical protein